MKCLGFGDYGWDTEEDGTLDVTECPITCCLTGDALFGKDDQDWVFTSSMIPVAYHYCKNLSKIAFANKVKYPPGIETKEEWIKKIFFEKCHFANVHAFKLRMLAMDNGTDDFAARLMQMNIKLIWHDKSCYDRDAPSIHWIAKNFSNFRGKTIDIFPPLSCLLLTKGR